MIALVALVLALAPAAPDTAVDREGARAHFESGVALLDAKDFAGAAKELELSIAAKETLPALYDLAVAYRGLEAYARACNVLRRFFALAEDNPAPEGAEDKARALFDELSAKLAHLELGVRGGATRVLVNGVEVGKSDGTYPQELDPGKHLFAVERDGYARVEQERALAEGESARLELEAGQIPLSGKVAIAAEPAGAELRIDGMIVGRDRFVAELTPGEHVVQAALDGHVTQEQRVRAIGGREVALHLVLAEEESTPLYGQWWFWTAVGVAVAGTATALIVATADRSPIYQKGNTNTVVFALDP